VDLRVDILESIAEVDREAWNGLVDTAGAPVFYDHDFLAACEAAPLEPEVARAYLAVRDASSGDLLAAIPAYLYDPMDPYGDFSDELPGFPMRASRGVVSHLWHCYDTRVPAASSRIEVLAALCTALQDLARRWGAACFGFLNVDASRPEADLLPRLGFESRFLCDRFVLDLSACRTIDDYLRALRGDKRHEMTRQVRRAADAGIEVSWQEPSLSDIEEMVSLCRATAGRYGGESYYPAATFGRFLRRAGPTRRLLAVRSGPVLLGAIVCFLHGGRLHTWAGGARYDLTPRISPYYVGFYEAVRFAIAERVDRLEGGRGNPRFKRRYGLRPLPLLALLKRT